MASSLFTDEDEPIASVLTRTLLETKQEVPDFLQHHIPEGEDLKFEADSDFEPAGDAEDSGRGWGTENETATDGDAWGVSTSGNDDGWAN